MKKLCIFILTVVLILHSFPALGAAATSGSCGDSLMWEFSDNTLTVSGDGAMYDYSEASSAPWWGKRKSIKSVVIEDGVTSVGAYAFYGCVFDEVTIPSSIASIGDGAFYGCEKLTTVNYEAENAAAPYYSASYGGSVFYNCPIDEINFGNRVISIPEGLFWSSGSFTVTDIELPDSVRAIYKRAFCGVSSLSSVTIPASVAYIEDEAIYNCENVTVYSSDPGAAMDFAARAAIPFVASLITFDDDAPFVAVGGEYILHPSGRGKFEFSSSRPLVASVDDYGTVRGVSAGTARIYVENEYGDVESCRVSVVEAQAAEKITLSEGFVSMSPGTSRRITAAVEPSWCVGEIDWRSSDESVATVDGGVINAVSDGTARITATVDGISAVMGVRVGKITELDLSEINFATSASNLNTNLNYNLAFNTGRTLTNTYFYLTNWIGPVYEADDPYPFAPEGAVYNDIDEIAHVQEILYLPRTSSMSYINAVKRAVMEYGAVSAPIAVNYDYWDNNRLKYYLPARKSYSFAHAVNIVGWDDDYSKTNFIAEPEGDGAFICKNTWGTWRGEGGYFYLSYYDSYLRNHDMYVFNSLEDKTNYDKIYQYDDFGPVVTAAAKDELLFASVYPREGQSLEADETLRAAAFYTYNSNARYEVFVIPDFTDMSQLENLGESAASGEFEYQGYHTVVLDEAVELSANTRFAVVVRIRADGKVRTAIEAPLSTYCTAARANSGDGFWYRNGAWSDLTGVTKNANWCLKAFTDASASGIVEEPEYESDTVYGAEDFVLMGYDVNPEYIDYESSPRLFASSPVPSPIRLFADAGSRAVDLKRFDLRDEGRVSSVKNQLRFDLCWAFTSLASLESCNLKRRSTDEPYPLSMSVTGGFEFENGRFSGAAHIDFWANSDFSPQSADLIVCEYDGSDLVSVSTAKIDLSHLRGVDIPIDADVNNTVKILLWDGGVPLAREIEI